MRDQFGQEGVSSFARAVLRGNGGQRALEPVPQEDGALDADERCGEPEPRAHGAGDPGVEDDERGRRHHHVDDRVNGSHKRPVAATLHRGFPLPDA